MTPIQILLARAPCYQESARITSLIELAETEIGPDAYGDLRSNAVALLTLHWLALSERGKSGAAGAITSEAEGDLSRSYASPESPISSLSSTMWGQELESLGKKTTVSFINRRYGAF